MQKLSIVVPIFRAEKYIKNNLNIMKNSFSTMFNAFEIIAVIDGMMDNSYHEAKQVNGITIIEYKDNKGKGYALKHGYKYITGDIVTFLDSDMDLHPKLLKNFMPYLKTADVIIGSKRHPFSKMHYPFHRRIMSKIYQIYSQLVLGVNLSDTQSGIKLFKREVLDVILPLITVDGFAFDVELCFLAKKHKFRVVEAPINLTYQLNCSTIKFKAIMQMITDTMAIRYRYSVLKEYQKEFWKIYFKN